MHAQQKRTCFYTPTTGRVSLSMRMAIAEFPLFNRMAALYLQKDGGFPPLIDWQSYRFKAIAELLFFFSTMDSRVAILPSCEWPRFSIHGGRVFAFSQPSLPIIIGMHSTNKNNTS